MSLRQILLLIVTTLFFWFAHWSYCCKSNNVCYSCNDSNFDTTTVQKVILPDGKIQNVEPFNLRFAWGTTSVDSGSLFSAFKEKLISQKSNLGKLEIIGTYQIDEENPTNFKNLGIARANTLKRLLDDYYPVENIVLKSKQIDIGDVNIPEHIEPILNLITIEPAISERVKSNSSFKIQKDDEKVLIYFPYNSVKKIEDKAIFDYLSVLAEELIESSKYVLITGYTSNKGTKRGNLNISERRAKMIRDVLRKMGVPRNKIKTIGKGDLDPLAPNDSEENRAKNRRVEIIMLDK